MNAVESNIKHIPQDSGCPVHFTNEELGCFGFLFNLMQKLIPIFYQFPEFSIKHSNFLSFSNSPYNNSIIFWLDTLNQDFKPVFSSTLSILMKLKLYLKKASVQDFFLRGIFQSKPWTFC
jgi:hypothetical protein